MLLHEVTAHPATFQVLLLRAALNHFSAQLMFVFMIAPAQVQDFALGLVELNKIHREPPLKPAKVSLESVLLPPACHHTAWCHWQTR